MSDTWTTARARLAATRRHHPTADLTAERQALRVARAEEYVRRLIDEAPPLTVEQRERLAVLLRSGDAA